MLVAECLEHSHLEAHESLSTPHTALASLPTSFLSRSHGKVPANPVTLSADGDCMGCTPTCLLVADSELRLFTRIDW